MSGPGGEPKAGSLTDGEFLAAFEACSLTRADWTHRAHVRMAWLYLTRLSFPEALLAIRKGIQKLNETVIKSTGYHETVTVALSKIIGERCSAGNRWKSWDEFSSGNPDLLDRECRVLLSYYSKERIHSSEAKASFVEPDLAPLPDPQRSSR